MRNAVAVFLFLLCCAAARAGEEPRLAVDLFFTPKKDKPGVALESSVKGALWITTMPLISKGHLAWRVELDFGSSPVSAKSEVHVSIFDLEASPQNAPMIFNASFPFQDGKKITLLDTNDYKLQATCSLDSAKEAAREQPAPEAKKE